MNQQGPPPYGPPPYGAPPPVGSYQGQGYGYGYPGHAPIQPMGWRCIHCGYHGPPNHREKVSTGGWIIFALMLIVCFPLFWIGLLMKETYTQCPSCGTKVG